MLCCSKRKGRPGKSERVCIGDDRFCRKEEVFSLTMPKLQDILWIFRFRPITAGGMKK